MKKIIFTLLLVMLSSLSFANLVLADNTDGLAISISPPLFKVNLEPGSAWASTVKLINNNSYEMTMYAQVLDFKSGDQGGVRFLDPIASTSSTDKYALSQWINITDQPIVLPPFGSQEVQFTIAVPKNASPGGHYAAILVGNQPPTTSIAGSNIKVSSKLASLILARVSGDIKEQGDVREFSVDKMIAGDLKADFKVIFENTGNTHLRPQGEIKITNLFGQTRGDIEINHQADYGNVLPDSQKKWQFNWQGESSVLDAGLMKADLLMNYGEDNKQSVVRSIYFWTFSMKPTLVVLGIILTIILLIYLLIRTIIRRSLRDLREQTGLRAPRQARAKAVTKAVLNSKPVVKGSNLDAYSEWDWQLIRKLGLIGLGLIIILAALFFMYIRHGQGGGSLTELKTNSQLARY